MSDLSTSMSNKKCCVPGCDNMEGARRALHIFPNPAKDAERFTTWVLSIGGDIVGLSNMFIYKNRRVCHAHFEEKFCCRYHRISNIAVPTLNLPGPLALPRYSLIRAPSRQDQNQEIMPIVPENVPVTPKGPVALPKHSFIRAPSTQGQDMQQIMPDVPSTSKEPVPVMPSSFLSRCPLRELQNLKETVPSSSESIPTASKVIIATKTRAKTVAEHNLHKKLIKMRVKVSKYRSKVKKQMAHIKASKKIIENPAFLKTIEDLPSASKKLTMMQLRETKKKNKGRRFTTEEKILALSIFKQSPKAYRFLRKLLILPAPQTLSKLVQNANLTPGVNKKVFAQLKKRASQMKIQDRLCVLLFDEMALAASVSYNERKDRVTGFVNNGKKIISEYADHAQVFMIRGLIKNYKQPLSYSFSAAATKGPELCAQIKDVVKEVQDAGLIVVATICDQGSNNRQALKLLLQETRGVLLRAGQQPKDKVIIINGQEIIPLYDPPHMLKCIRNNLLTKHLKYITEEKSKIAKWEHLELLFKENPGYRGIRLIPKLTIDHIVPSRIPKMKVKYASQVFSKAVANNMGYLADKGILPEECKETADLLLFFDELFDSVNGSFGKNINAKPLLGPVKPNSTHHKVWNDAKIILKSMKFVDQKSGKAESVPTLNNWVWTLDGIQILLKKIKSSYGITSVWMRHLNQDPIENYFGAIRSHGCRNTNPTAEKFESAFTTLLLNNMSSVHAIGTNCEKDFCANLHSLVITDCEDTTTTCEFNEIPDIIITPLEEKKDPRILGPLQYVSGYVLKQTQKNIFKNCEHCKKELSSDTAIDYIKYREYTGARWLSSPSDQLLSVVSNLQDLIYCILKQNLEKLLLKEYLKTLILMLIDFSFSTCQQHREKLIDFLINLTCRFFIYNHCKNINRIISGKRDIEDEEDIFAVKAKKIFQKHMSRKRGLTSK